MQTLPFCRASPLSGIKVRNAPAPAFSYFFKGSECKAFPVSRISNPRDQNHEALSFPHSLNPFNVSASSKTVQTGPWKTSYPALPGESGHFQLKQSALPGESNFIPQIIASGRWGFPIPPLPFFAFSPRRFETTRRPADLVLGNWSTGTLERSEVLGGPPRSTEIK